MLISKNLHNKSSEVSIKTRSTPASLSFKGQVTKHTTVKGTITVKECPTQWAQITVSKHIILGMRFQECRPRLWMAVEQKRVLTNGRGLFSCTMQKEKRPLLAGKHSSLTNQKCDRQQCRISGCNSIYLFNDSVFP